VPGQYLRGVAQHDDVNGADLLGEPERINWLIWRVNRHLAEETIGFFWHNDDRLKVDQSNLRKCTGPAHEFVVCIGFNAARLIDYGEPFRAGERISSCLAASTANTAISKRFTKREEMQWTKCGAHLLLQTRARTLGATPRPFFQRRYPAPTNGKVAGTAHAAAA
jgi:hypothetical protein